MATSEGGCDSRSHRAIGHERNQYLLFKVQAQGSSPWTHGEVLTISSNRNDAAGFVIDKLSGIAIANANSTPTFLRHLGFHLVTPLDVRMCLTLPRPSGAKIDWQWRRKWSAKDLAWRLDNPGGHYWRSAAADFSCIIGTTKYPGVRAVLKVESEPLLRRQAESQLRPRATWCPVLWFGKCPELRFQAAIDVPTRLRPSPFNFIFHALTSRKTRLMPEHVHFEAADFDVM